MTTVLGRLEPIPLRDVWPNESGDFTPWLAQDEHLSLLGETLGMELVLEAREKEVGAFKADILAKDPQNDRFVLIENQLADTDHSHLGQLLTYAAGLEAVTVIWIAAKFRNEHRAALDWLNAVTDQSYQFFAVEMELWHIGESATAPKFHVVASPNDWSRSVSSAARQVSYGPLTDMRQLQLDYWTAFREYLLEHSQIRPQKPPAHYWTNYFSLGNSQFNLSAQVYIREKQLAVLLNCKGPSAKQNFAGLLLSRDSIERELKHALDWRENTKGDSSQVRLNWPADPSDREDWPVQHRRIALHLEAFTKAFSPPIGRL